MSNIDNQILEYEEKLKTLKMQREKFKRPPKPKPTRGRGRPRKEKSEILIAKKLAEKYPITQVSLVTGIPVSTLYNYGIKRYKIPLKREKTA